MNNQNTNKLIIELSLLLGQSEDSGTIFYYYIKRYFERYLSVLDDYEYSVVNLLNNINDDFLGNATYKRFRNLMNKINTVCLEILELAYHGNIIGAMTLMRKLLLTQQYTDYKLKDRYVNYLQLEIGERETLYRCVDFKEGEIPESCGHVPFNLRHLASRGRFNLLGIPCLYLSNSLDCAQSESGAVKGRKRRWRGVFLPQRTLYFANFTIPQSDSVESMSEFDKFSFLITYPLRLLCLTKTRYEDVPFTEEYLFSQLFFHVLFYDSSDGFPKFDGICYSSTKALSGVNYVIPATYKQSEPPTEGTSTDVRDKIKEISVNPIITST